MTHGEILTSGCTGCGWLERGRHCFYREDGKGDGVRGSRVEYIVNIWCDMLGGILWQREYKMESFFIM